MSFKNEKNLYFIINMLLEKTFINNHRAKCWSDKNILKPYEVSKSSHKKYWFKCDKCSHEFEIGLDKITNSNRWCSYCSRTPKLLCENNNCEQCFNKSFASQPKSKFWRNSNNLKPRQVFNNSNKKYWFNCNVCKHNFDCSIANVNNGYWCPYCANQKLCSDNNCKDCYEKSFASQPKSLFWDKTNKINPREIFKCSSIKFNFNCNECNNIFNIRLYSIISGSWCSYCKNKTELKLFNWLKDQNLNIKHQVKFDWCKKIKHLPFDFVINDLKLIIELDGAQHFKQISNWKSPEETQINDQLKNQMAKNNGYRNSME